jgi:hypothetical protein
MFSSKNRFHSKSQLLEATKAVANSIKIEEKARKVLPTRNLKFFLFSIDYGGSFPLSKRKIVYQ